MYSREEVVHWHPGLSTKQEKVWAVTCHCKAGAL